MAEKSSTLKAGASMAAGGRAPVEPIALPARAQEPVVPVSPSRLPSRKALPPFEALRAFDAIARLGGVRKAAQYLCRDHAVVSRHLRTVEEWTGAKLIERTPAGAILTEHGQRYHRQIANAIDTIANATVDLMKLGENHRLEIWCMPGFAFHWLTGRLASFESSNPNLDIELRPTDAGPDFNRQEADVDIRLALAYGPPMEFPANVRAMEIARPPTIPVASPGYLARQPPIECPADFLRQQLLHEESFDCWGAWLAAHGMKDEVDLSGPRLWHAHLTLDAARRGRGVALTNHFVAGDDLAAGRLVEIRGTYAQFEPIALGVYMFVARIDRWNAAPIARFRHWLMAALGPHLTATTDAMD